VINALGGVHGVRNLQGMLLNAQFMRRLSCDVIVVILPCQMLAAQPGSELSGYLPALERLITDMANSAQRSPGLTVGHGDEEGGWRVQSADEAVDGPSAEMGWGQRSGPIGNGYTHENRDR
jgi:hypothetical protein